MLAQGCGHSSHLLRKNSQREAGPRCRSPSSLQLRAASAHAPFGAVPAGVRRRVIGRRGFAAPETSVTRRLRGVTPFATGPSADGARTGQETPSQPPKTDKQPDPSSKSKPPKRCAFEHATPSALTPTAPRACSLFRLGGHAEAQRAAPILSCAGMAPLRPHGLCSCSGRPTCTRLPLGACQGKEVKHGPTPRRQE